MSFYHFQASKMTDLEKFQEKRKQSIFQTIGTTFWRALEDLGQAMAGGNKNTKNKRNLTTSNEQVGVELDKFENGKISRSKI